MRRYCGREFTNEEMRAIVQMIEQAPQLKRAQLSRQVCQLLSWVRHQRMAVFAHGWLMVHAGVVPQWDTAQTLRLAGEVEQLLRSDALERFLPTMYGDEPMRWSDSLIADERLTCQCILRKLAHLHRVFDDRSAAAEHWRLDAPRDRDDVEVEFRRKATVEP